MLQLRAGPLDALFEVRGAFLRHVRLADREVLRGIYAAVRDRNWDTVEPNVRLAETDVRKDGFDLRFVVDCVSDEVDFGWCGRLRGAADGTIVFELDGEARSSFLRNRIGFCVLHPSAACAGEACRVRNARGEWLRGDFPKLVSPHQPFRDVQGIAHRVAGGVEVEVTLEGDVFETEDQRNWTDASFKTYCTPLALPFPARVATGDRVRQRVTLRLHSLEEGDAARAGQGGGLVSAAPVHVEVDPQRLRPLPKLGLGVASHGRPPSERQLRWLTALRLDHLRVDLRLGEPSWRQELEGANDQARQLGVRLQAAVTLADGDEDGGLLALAAEAAARQPPVSEWLVFHQREKSTSRCWLERARRAFSQVGITGRIVAGTNAYFAELNRERPAMDACDAVCYSVNPQVHAFDDRSLVESIEAQADTVVSALEISGGKPVLVSPLTLRPRFNPNATGQEPARPAGELPPQVDPRQPTLFAACWTLGSLGSLAAAGAASVTCFETTGWRGVMELEEGCALPARFPSRPGAVFPLYHVLADVGERASGSAAAVRSSDPLRVNALALVDGPRLRLLVCNHTRGALDVTLAVPGLAAGELWRMDGSNLEIATSVPEDFRRRPGERVVAAGERLELRLEGEAVVRLDAVLEGSRP